MKVNVRDPRFDDAVHSGRLKHMNLVSTLKGILTWISCDTLKSCITLLPAAVVGWHHCRLSWKGSRFHSQQAQRDFFNSISAPTQSGHSMSIMGRLKPQILMSSTMQVRQRECCSEKGERSVARTDTTGSC